MGSLPNRHPRVLLIEDHLLVARMTAELIEEIECEVVGPVCSLRAAMRLLEEGGRADVALVDLSLPDGNGEQLVERLKEMGIPCAVITGYARPANPAPVLADLPWLEKPLEHAQLRAVLRMVGLGD